MKNDPCPCSSGKKYRQCCWLRRFELAAPPRPPRIPAKMPPDGLYDPCPCDSGKVYRRCCYPRTFPDFTKPNLGIEPHLDHAATRRAYKRLASLPTQYQMTIDTVDVGRARLTCAAILSVGDDLPGTLAPPTPRQIEDKYDWIRESNPDGVTEVVVMYTYPEMFGLAEARFVFDADERFLLVDGRTVSVLDLHRGMRVVMGDGTVGTILGHPERRYDIPVPPLEREDGRWLSRVIGRVKHTADEVVEFRWGGQVVSVTPGHEVWSADRRGWVGAHELYPGERIRVGGNVVAPVEGWRRVPGLVEVYGIEVEYFHNYYVGTGDDAMLVHNGPACLAKPIVVASDGVNAATAQVVRQIGCGERVGDLIQELAQRTYASGGLEHAIISLRNGQRLIVSGGSGGITFEAFGVNLRRVILHTHPRVTGPSPPDFLMLQQLGQKSSWIYELFGGGLTKFGR
ncbi:MAG: SEC-C domain-containing protein [Bacteroidales bacterium]|nr:SEC-C domain-containing protein [Bacteroidales bacterium]